LPTYGYRCPACSLEFDVWQRMTDKPEADCPKCGAPARRLFFPAGIVFKGSGFYKTDNRAAGTSTESTPTKTSADGSTAKTKTGDTGSKAASGSTPAPPD